MNVMMTFGWVPILLHTLLVWPLSRDPSQTLWRHVYQLITSPGALQVCLVRKKCVPLRKYNDM